MAPAEREYQISPIVMDSIVHNTKTLTNIQSLGATLFGVSAGILGLESYSGFIFYFIFYTIITSLFFLFRVLPSSSSSSSTSPSSPKPNAAATKSSGMLDVSMYYRSNFEFWTGAMLGGLPSYILTWTLFYGIVRA